MANGIKRLLGMVSGGFDKWINEHEDPITALRQDIEEGIEEYSKLTGKHGVQQHVVEEARKDVKKYEDLVDRYNKVARAAVVQNNDVDATRALEYITKYEGMLETAKSTLGQAETTEHQMAIDLLEYADILEKSKVELKNMESQIAGAEAKEAKASFKGSFLAGGEDRLARAKSKVAERVAKAEAKDKLGNGGAENDPLLSKYDVDDKGVNSRLAALKAELGK